MLELYPDNPAHVAAFDFICSSDWVYLYILHHIIDIDGQEILQGEGKPHYHVIIIFDNPVYASALARKLGLIQDSGEPDLQFIQSCKNLNDSLLYLTHIKYEDKEHYSPDDLKGSRQLRKQYDRALFLWIEKKRVDVRTALIAFQDWVNHQHGVITSKMVVSWIVQTPYLKYRNERLFHDLINEHNAKCYNERHSSRLQEISEGLHVLNRVQIEKVSGSDCEYLEISDDELQEMGFEYDGR